jgi:hypothetical protein
VKRFVARAACVQARIGTLYSARCTHLTILFGNSAWQRTIRGSRLCFPACSQGYVIACLRVHACRQPDLNRFGHGSGPRGPRCARSIQRECQMCANFQHHRNIIDTVEGAWPAESRRSLGRAWERTAAAVPQLVQPHEPHSTSTSTSTSSSGSTAAVGCVARWRSCSSAHAWFAHSS